MNDALRILDKLLKKSGYAIKKHFEYNLLPLSNFKNYTEQEAVYKTFDAPKNNSESSIDKLEICLRVCINEKRQTVFKRSHHISLAFFKNT